MKQVFILQSSVKSAVISLHLSKRDDVNVVSKSDADELAALLDIVGVLDLVIVEQGYFSSMASLETRCTIDIRVRWRR